MSDSTHNMKTRSKVLPQEMKSPESDVSLSSEVDEHGNLKEFIDYEEKKCTNFWYNGTRWFFHC